MRVLVVYAHHNPQSFCHAVLEQVTRGLGDAGHDYEVLDLHEVGFNPVFTSHDGAQFVHHTTPETLLDRAQLEKALIDAAGNPIKRILAKRWLRGKSLADIVRMFEQNQPADVRAHQAKVAKAEGLIFIAPVFWMSVPAMLKGWMERVFSYGFAYTLNADGWAGDLSGRVPLLSQRKGLFITPTFFTEAEYDRGWRDAMDTVLCDWSLKMAGVQQTEHVYFYAVVAAGPEGRREYLEEAYRLGKDY